VRTLHLSALFTSESEPPSSHNSGNEEEDAALKQLRASRAELESELDIANSQASILEDYSKSMKSQHATAEQLTSFLKTFSESQRDIVKQRTNINGKIEQLDKEIERKEKENRADPQSSRRQAGVNVIVLANSDGPVELSLTYTVFNASWTPLYDVRADIVGSEDAKPGRQHKVDLHYRASIFQSTGEDWKDVHLTLSTASPQTGSSIPKLTGQSVMEDVPVTIAPATPSRLHGMAATAGAAPSPLSSTFRKRALRQFSVVEESAYAMSAPVMEVAVASTDNSNQGFSSTFGINGLSTIPSDTDSSAEKHKVTIAVVELTNVDLEWITIPKRLTTTYLRVSPPLSWFPVSCVHDFLSVR
jgi:uncharacterized protein (TIGR02231 family)